MILLNDTYIKPLNGIVIVIILLFVLQGYRKGGLRSILSCFGTIFSFPLSWKISDTLAKQNIFLTNTNGEVFQQIYDIANHCIWFVLVFICCKILLLLMDLFFKSLQRVPVYHAVSCVSGFVFGGIESFVWLCVVCILLQSPLFYNGKEILEHSYLCPIEKIGERISIAFMQPMQQTMDWLNSKDQIDAIQDILQKKN